MVTDPPSDIVSCSESGYVNRCEHVHFRLALIQGRLEFHDHGACEERFEPSHPPHVEGGVVHFGNLDLASRDDLSPAISLKAAYLASPYF